MVLKVILVKAQNEFLQNIEYRMTPLNSGERFRVILVLLFYLAKEGLKVLYPEVSVVIPMKDNCPMLLE